jgi:hypothetical protein
MADFEKSVSLIEVDVDLAQAQKDVENLTSAILDQKDAVKANTDEIKDLEKQNKELQKEVKTGTKTQEEANTAITENQKKVKEIKTANEGLRDGIKDLNKERLSAVKATKLQSNSLDALRKKSADLKKELNKETIGSERFDELTESLSDVNGQIRELDQAAGDFKTSVGNYPEILNDISGGAIESAKGFASMTKAAAKFMLTPIGLVVGAIAAAFLLVKNAMDRSEEQTNKIRRSFAGLTGIVNKVLGALEPLGEYLIDGIVKGFELAGEAADKTMSLLSDGLSLLGFDEAAKEVKNFTKETKEAIKASQELADLEANLAVKQREATKIQLDFQKEAEKLRQIRDDDTKSFKERIAANEELGKVLKTQLGVEEGIAKLRLRTIDERIKLEGETSELLDNRAEALTEIADIQERITGQESEQLVNRNALEKEAEQSATERMNAEKERLAEMDGILKTRKEKQKEDQEKEDEEREERQEKIFASMAAAMDKDFDAKKEAAEKEKELEQKKAAVIADIKQKALNLDQQIAGIAFNNLEREGRKKQKKLEKDLKEGLITEEQYAARKEALEKGQALRKWEIEKKAFAVDKVIRSGQIIADTAKSISASVAAFPITGGMPFAAINAAIGAVQLANVLSTPPPPKPTFAEGGVVINGKSHSQGGEDIHVGGRLVGNMQGGEGLFVTKREATMAMLNDYNTQAGGHSMFSGSHRFLQNGGAVDTSGGGMSAAELGAALAAMPTPVVQVQSIMAGINAEGDAENVGII